RRRAGRVVAPTQTGSAARESRKRGSEMTTLHRRTTVAALAVVTAALTSAGAAALGNAPPHALGGIIYFGVVVGALLQPGALTAQVIAGQLLAGSLLLSPEPPSLLRLAPIVAGVIATAELLALAHRMNTSFAPATTGAPRRIGGAVLA